MHFLNIIDTVKTYRVQTARDDFLAAITVTIMLVPQSLAYAMLAGLPPEVGLYSSILPLIAYAVFGTSIGLAVGPVAVLSLMTASTIADVSVSGDYSPISVGISLAVLSGAILIVLGLCRMGFIVNFISRSVIEGFIAASAILIIVSQIKHILGIDMSGHNLYELISTMFLNSTNTHVPTSILGGCVIISLMLAKPLIKKIAEQVKILQQWREFLPRVFPAIMVVLTIFLMQITSLSESGIDVVGHIPSGIPNLSVVNIEFDLFEKILLPAFLLAIIGYVESISVATRFAAKTRTFIEPNSELVGLGAANIVSGISGGMPVTGGFSRSVVNFNAGSKTPLSGVYSALFITIMVTSLMSLLQQLPKATLAATIIVAVIGLIDIKKIKKFWSYSKSDFFLMLVTILVTLFFGVEVGISIGIILSIAIHLYQTSKPHMAIIGQVPGTEHFRNVLRHDVTTVPEIIGVRIDESLYFANATYLEREILKIVSSNKLIQHCVLMFSSVSDVDASALETLELINMELKELDIQLHLSEVKGPVYDKLVKTSLLQELEGRVHLSHYQAIKDLTNDYCNNKAESDVYETNLNSFK